MALRKWTRYRREKSRALRDELIVEHLPLVRHIAGRLAVRLSAAVSAEDLEGWGVFGLIEAVEKYDPAQGTEFKTYAYYRIRGAILDELRRQSWVPRSLWQKLQRINEVREQLEREGGQSVTESDLAGALGLSPQEYGQLSGHFYRISLASLDDMRFSPDGEPITWGDVIEDRHGADPLEPLLEEENRADLIRAIGRLEERDRLILALYYQDGLTLKELGRVLGVTESRTCQLHARAINRLREWLQTGE